MKINLFKAALFTPMSKGRWGLPLCAWSKPGEGKTNIIRECVQSFGMVCVVLSPGEMGEGAFGVIPVPDRSGVIKYPPGEWVLNFREDDGKGSYRDLPGVVFVDEGTCTPPAIQPAILGLVLDGRIGGTVLGPRVRRLMAANPPEYGANAYDLNAAQANRMGHVEWTAPTVEEHTAYMMRGTTGHDGNGHAEFSADKEEQRVLDLWGAAWAWAVGMETAFLAARPTLKNQCPLATDPAASRAWPSDRSWENATRALASARVHGLTPAETDEFVSAFIGNKAYAEWKVWIKEQDLPDAAQLLDGKVTFTHDKARLDRTVAVLNACVTLVSPVSAPMREGRTIAFWKMIAALFADTSVSQDLIIVPAQQLIAAKLGSNATDPKVRAAYSELGRQQRWIDLLKLSGLGK